MKLEMNKNWEVNMHIFVETYVLKILFVFFLLKQKLMLQPHQSINFFFLNHKFLNFSIYFLNLLEFN